MKTFEIKQSPYPYLKLKTLLLWITQRKPDWITAHLNTGFQMHHIFLKKWTLFISAYAGYQSNCRKGHKINYQPSFDPNTLPLLHFPTPENSEIGPYLFLILSTVLRTLSLSKLIPFLNNVFICNSINFKLCVRFSQMLVFSHDSFLPSKWFFLKCISWVPPCLAWRDKKISLFEESKSVHLSHHNEVHCCTEVFHSYMQYKQENKCFSV